MSVGTELFETAGVRLVLATEEYAPAVDTLHNLSLPLESFHHTLRRSARLVASCSAPGRK